MSLMEIFKDAEIEKQKDKFFGVAIALVTNNEDPEKLGRVKIKFPWLSDENESNWARVAVLMAGKETGTWFPPQIDDEVLVAFEHGNINRPIVIGALWNGKDVPPAEELETILIKDKLGNTIEVNSKDKFIKITAEGEMSIEAKNITFTASENKIIIDAGANDIAITGNNITIEASGNLNTKASGTHTIEGSLVDINP